MGSSMYLSVYQDLHDPRLVHQLETVLYVSLRELSGSHGLLVHVETHPGIVLEHLTLLTHDGHASRRVAVSREDRTRLHRI